MSKDKISDYSTTASDNTDIAGIGTQGTNLVSNFDNAFRTIMKQLADMNAGTSPIFDTFTLCDPADTTKKVRIDAGTVATATTRVLTMPDSNVTISSFVASVINSSSTSLVVPAQGTEGGEILLTKGSASTLSGTGVILDQVLNSIRLLESGGSSRGFTLGIDTGTMSHSVAGVFWNATNATASIGTSGYQKFPNGLIRQWSAYSGVAGDATVAFPIAFPAAVFGITVSPYGDPGANAWTASGEGATLSAFNVRRRVINAGAVSVGNFPVYWEAWGN